jgi:hypothetical protein
MFAGLYAHEQTEKLQDNLHASTADPADANDKTNGSSSGASINSRSADGNQAAEAYGKFTHQHMLPRLKLCVFDGCVCVHQWMCVRSCVSC